MGEISQWEVWALLYEQSTPIADGLKTVMSSLSSVNNHWSFRLDSVPFHWCLDADIVFMFECCVAHWAQFLWQRFTLYRFCMVIINTIAVMFNLGGGDSSVVRAPDSWLKGRGFESLLERRENFLLQGRLSVLTLISVSVPPPCYHSST